MGLISAEKFTVVGRITDSMYQKFKQIKPDEKLNNNHLLAKMITEKFENTLQWNGVSQSHVKIADISFAFDNYTMLRLLKHRTEALMAAKFKSVAQIEDKMTREKNVF